MLFGSLLHVSVTSIASKLHTRNSYSRMGKKSNYERIREREDPKSSRFEITHEVTSVRNETNCCRRLKYGAERKAAKCLGDVFWRSQLFDTISKLTEKWFILCQLREKRVFTRRIVTPIVVTTTKEDGRISRSQGGGVVIRAKWISFSERGELMKEASGQ